MKAELVSLDKRVVGEVALSDSVFGLEARVDIIKRVIDWQLAKARSGTHSVKTVGEVSGTTKKPFKQKGTGNARQGNARGVQRRGGGIAHGPQVRSHEIKLQKKVRSLGLRHALSIKLSEGALHFVDSVEMKHPKTAELVKSLANFGSGKFFIIDGATVDNNFKLSAASAINTCVVPAIGANVYDIISSDHVLISKNALSLLEERLK
ncbi:MAG: 50S ribosomal protein L4 [Rickettsiaceae bacterium]|nr:50S ribosomal protein L4 [Rickettsiaceae bacterium]MDP4832285.1 50S ribosomal protein L4 [Rickettsiaceae bacterium]MDP5020260.1 50S ribosomal protein L4 [Rickettsiaceae bacterium]MDP5083123.1 50S ribosomal protein L4 [Rickettsiaceae bacterium]